MSAKVQIDIKINDGNISKLAAVGEKISAFANAANKAWTSVGANLAKTGASLYAISTATSKMYGFAKGAAYAGKEIADLAEVTGASTRDIQVLGGELGDNVQAASVALGKLQKAKQAALTKGGEELDAFKAAGISVDDLRKKKPDELLMQMADAFQKSGNAGAKLLITQKLMGKGVDSLVEVLNKGSGELLGKYREMEEAGAILSDKQLNDAKNAEGAFRRLELTWIGLKKAFGNQVAVGLSATVAALANWFAANQGLIQQKIDVFLMHLPAIIEAVSGAFKVFVGVGKLLFGVFEGLSHLLGAETTGWIIALLALAPTIISVVSAIGATVTVLGALMVTMKNFMLYARLALMVFQLLGLVVGMFAQGALVSLASKFMLLARVIGGGVVKAFNILRMAMMTNPFMLLIAGLVLVGALIYANWDSIVSYVTKAWQRIKAVFDAQGFFGGMWQIVLEMWQGGLNAIVGMMKQIPFLDKLIGKDFKFEFADKRAEAVTAGKVAKAQQQNFNGKLQIDVKSDGKARVTNMQSDNKGMQMDAKHGMAGAPA